MWVGFLTPSTVLVRYGPALSSGLVCSDTLFLLQAASTGSIVPNLSYSYWTKCKDDLAAGLYPYQNDVLSLVSILSSAS